MSDKAKAAMPGRQCGYACQRGKITRLAAGSQKGSYRGCSIAGAKLRPRENQRVNCYQPFGSMPCRRNSARASSFIQFPRLTPSRSAAASSCSLNSGTSLTLNIGDFPEPFGLLSLLIVDMYRPVEIVLIVLGLYTNMHILKKTTPQSAGTLLRRLTSTDK